MSEADTERIATCLERARREAVQALELARQTGLTDEAHVELAALITDVAEPLCDLWWMKRTGYPC